MIGHEDEKRFWGAAQRLMAAIGWALAGIGALPSAQAQDVTPPNVVVIVTDDLDMASWRKALELGLLPHIQAHLVSQGTEFSESFVSESLCCPSRATLLTGQYAHNHGVARNQSVIGGFDRFRDGSTLATWLQAAGYRTGLVGKYLNGYDSASYVPPGYDLWNSLVDSHNTYCNYNWGLVTAPGLVVRYGDTESDYKTDVLAHQAAQFVDDPDPRPFFLLLAPPSPHYETCLDDFSVRGAPRHIGTVNVDLPAASLASFNEEDLSDKPAWMRGRQPVNADVQRRFFNEIIEAMRSVDDMVGTLFQRLEASGRLAQTMVIFTSDNGLQFGTHRRTGKRDLYEESIRVPMVVRAPGQTVPAQRSDWVLNVDLAPTIVDYAGASPGLVMDGRSMRPLLGADAASPAWRQSLLVEYPYLRGEPTVSYPYYGVRTKAPLLTLDSSGAATLMYAHTLDWRSGRSIAVEYYDLIADPLQLTSIHRSTAPIDRQRIPLLRSRLQQMATCAGDTCRALEE